MMVRPAERIRRNPKVVGHELTQDEGGVLLHLDTGAYHGVNRIGWLIWSLLEGTRTMGEVVADLRHRLEDAPPDLEEEVAAFLTDLEKRSLVESVPAGPDAPPPPASAETGP